MKHECCFPEWEQEIWLYLDEELAEEDRIRLERHLQNCARCRRFYADIRPIEDDLRAHFRRLGGDRLLEEFADEVVVGLPAMVRVPYLRRAWLDLRRGLSPQTIGRTLRRHPATAVALVILCLGTVWLANVEQEQNDYRVALITADNRVCTVPLSESIRCADPDGTLYQLPDGSLLLAHPGAIFSIEAYQNNGADRWISLKRGEIWLDVEMDAEEGFTVSTVEARVKVTGTCFAVRIEHQRTYVEVARGAVLVENAGRTHPKSRRLNCGEKIVADRAGRLLDWGEIPTDRMEEVRAPFQSFRASEEMPSRSKSDALYTLPQR